MVIEDSSSRAKPDESQGGLYAFIVFCICCVVRYVCFVSWCVVYAFG